MQQENHLLQKRVYLSIFILCLVIFFALPQYACSLQHTAPVVQKPIDRFALVNRHNVILNEADPLALTALIILALNSCTQNYSV
jgi:hypothetical protein